jgi:hypothetical protein
LEFGKVNESNFIWGGPLIESEALHCLRDTFMGKREYLKELNYEISLSFKI